MANKEIKFSMAWDTAEFDRGIQNAVKQLKELTNLAKGPQPGAGGAAASGQNPMLQKPMMESFFKSMHALRTNMDSAMRNYGKEQMKLMKDIAKEEERRGKLLQDQEKLSKNRNRDLQEELRVKKELKTTEEQISRLQTTAGKNRVTFNAAMSANKGQTMPVFVTNWPGGRGPGGGGGGGPGEGDADRGGGFDWKKLMSIKGIQSLMGMAAVAAAAGVVKDYGGMPIHRTAALGGATQSLAGQQLQELYGGNVITGMGWEAERKKAEDAAEQKLKTDQLSDIVLSPKSWLGGGASLLQGITGLGGKAPNRVSNFFGGAADDYFSTLQAQQMEGKGQAYEQYMAGAQQQQKTKMEAQNWYQGRYQGDLQMQRMMGLTDQGLYGGQGIMQRAAGAGFTGDMALQQAQAIQGAGGSTRGMQGNSILALQAQRGMGMTNAGSVLGQISGGAGGAEQSERIFKRILAEGMKDGLDKSEAVEELRRFSQMTAEVVSKTGAYTETDAQRVIEGFSRFQAGGIPTMREQEGAKAAYQEYQDFSAATSGRGGAMQYAALTQSGLAGKLNPRQIGSLMEMPEEDITASNPFIVSTAVAAGMTPDEMARTVINSKRTGVQATGGMNPEWQKILKKAGIQGRELGFEELKKLQATNPEAFEAYQQTEAAQGNISAYGGVQKRSAGVRGLQTMGPIEAGGALPGTGGVDARLGAPTGRMGDDATRALAASSQKALENFREFKDVLVPTAEAVNKVTTALKGVIEVTNAANERDKAAILQGGARQLHQTSPTQPQAGKSKPGQ